MTIQDLFNDIRPKVGDRNANKFSNQRIIEIINEGLEDMAKKANVKKSVIALPITPYQRNITIPDTNFLRLQRVRQNNKDIEKYTHQEIDSRVGRWEEKVGTTLEAIVYDLQNPRNFILYPLIDETETTWEALNNNTSGTLLLDIPNVPADSVYGIITSIDVDDIITPENVYDNEEIASYNPITSLSDVFHTIEFTYFAKPDKLSTTETDLTTVVDLDEQYKNTLVYYVAGVLLLDDNRTESIQRAQLFMQKYTLELKKDIGRTSDSYQGIDYPEIPYRTGF